MLPEPAGPSPRVDDPLGTPPASWPACRSESTGGRRTACWRGKPRRRRRSGGLWQSPPDRWTRTLLGLSDLREQHHHLAEDGTESPCVPTLQTLFHTSGLYFTQSVAMVSVTLVTLVSSLAELHLIFAFIFWPFFSDFLLFWPQHFSPNDHMIIWLLDGNPFNCVQTFRAHGGWIEHILEIPLFLHPSSGSHLWLILWDLSTTIEYISNKYCADIHVPQRMNPTLYLLFNLSSHATCEVPVCVFFVCDTSTTSWTSMIFCWDNHVPQRINPTNSNDRSVVLQHHLRVSWSIRKTKTFFATDGVFFPLTTKKALLLLFLFVT